MSYRVTYFVKGEIVIPNEVLSRLKQTPEEIQRINEIKILGDDMTMRQFKELQQLEKESVDKTITYSGIKITTKPETDESSAHLYIKSNFDSAYIPGFDGNNLDFRKIDGALVARDKYIDDNYDENIQLVVDIASAFKSTIDIIYESDEAGNSEEDDEEDDEEEKITYHIVGGKRIKLFAVL
jgi:hypothetical protein